MMTGRIRGWYAALVLGLAASGLSSTADAQTSAGKGTMVSFKGGANVIKGYLAKPEGKGPFPAVVLVHEWWGLSEWVKENADRIARNGYVALAVDLYNGKVTNDAGEAHELMRALDQNEGLADLKAGVAYLENQPFVAKSHKIAAIGWCMGGNYARLISQASEAVGPTVICYGAVATEADQIAKLKAKPVLGIFGATDRGIPAEKVKQFGDMLKQGGNKDVQIKIYDGAGHGFMRPGGPQYNANAASDAWEQIDAFLASHLKS